MFRFVELVEPSRGQHLLATLNHIVSSNATIFHTTTILADIFVFAYPILLIALFLYGRKHKNISYQHHSLQILTSAITATVITIFIQQLVRKDRPESLPGLQLILSHVPSISFPSDHATISMAIAVGAMLIRYHNKQQYNHAMKYVARGLFFASIVMGIARIAVAVHRPSDILVGWIIGIIGGARGRHLYNRPFVQKRTKWCIAQANIIVTKIMTMAGVTSK